MHEQAALLQKAGIESVRLRFSNGQRRGYRRDQFEEALRNERRPSRADQLRLIVTSGLNFTQNHRFEFATGVAAGAVE